MKSSNFSEPKQSFEDRDEIEQFFGTVIAEIIDPVGNLVDRRVIMGRNGARHDVVDVGKVARHPTFVENLDRSPGEDSACEQVGGHVRPSPGTINGKEPQARRRQAIKVAVGTG
jgi:hypothetical protein